LDGSGKPTVAPRQGQAPPQERARVARHVPISRILSPHLHPQEMRLYSFLVGASLMGSVVGFMPSMRVQQRGLGKCLSRVGMRLGLGVFSFGSLGFVSDHGVGGSRP